MLENLPENELTDKIIGCAIEVHKEYGGPGLKESAYEAALEWELKQSGLKVFRQKPVPVVYKGHRFEMEDEHPKRFDKRLAKDNPAALRNILREEDSVSEELIAEIEKKYK